MSDFMKSAGELSSKISGIRNEYEEILSAVAAAKKEKTRAKDRYNRCIDEGSEAGLKDCLKIIRACNETIEGLPASRENFYGKISGLEDKYKELMVNARQNIEEAQGVLDRQKKAVAEAEEKSKRVQRVSGEISTLGNLITKSGDVSSSETNEEI